MRLVLLASLTACAVPAEPELGTIEQGLRCAPDFCGTNSPLMTKNGVWELSLKGRRNEQGFRILGFGKDADFYTLLVKDSRIIGLDAHGNVALEGARLIGARIYLERSGVQTAIEITAASEIKELVAPHQLLGSYVLDWGVVVGYRLPGPMYAGQTAEGGFVPVLGPTAAVCPVPEWYEESYVGSMMEWDETTYSGMWPFQSLVFEGDRFDPIARTVQPLPDDNWFNIGCGVHTLAKLRLTRNTIHTAPSWRQVQAAMKMLGADYCGGGKAFTFPGEPLVWRDLTAMPYRSMNAKHELEARWDENGARCINSPRLARTYNPAGPATYANIWQAIEDECLLRGRTVHKCKDTDPASWDGELVTSANYD